MCLITFDFFTNGNLFPTRMIAVYAILNCMIFLMFSRFFIKHIRALILKRRIGAKRIIIVGKNENVKKIIENIIQHPNEGYEIVGIVSLAKYIPKTISKKICYRSLRTAFRKNNAEIILHADNDKADEVYQYAIKNHLLYYYAPSETRLSQVLSTPELLGDLPVVRVNFTPLIDDFKLVKRFFDLSLSIIFFILSLPLCIVILIIQKITHPKAPIFFSQIRLSSYNKKIKIYKFRTLKPEYSGLTPERAFQKMQKQKIIKNAKEYIIKYRKNGDSLDSDPRFTRFGSFLRRTSLDELPQLINVIKGDISLIGPRALIPGELKNYGDRELLLSIKSGLTGLAQVSGRRNLTFAQRRHLDLYYIQNWSLKLDLEILIKTFKVVITGGGAR